MDKTTNPANNAAAKTATLDAAHPLAQSIEVFRAGKHIDSKGRENTFTEADLDSMVAAHEAQPAPAVIGHPETTDPAMGWVSSLKRVGGKLYAQFKDWNPTFVDAVDAGGYRNRSVSVSKNGDGWMVNHVGWLGAKLPAVAGMAALAYSAHKLEAYEFESVWESDEYQTANGLDAVADLLGGLRDQLIADKGVDEANTTLSKWRIDSLREIAMRLRAIADKEDESKTNPAFSQGAISMFTQEDLNRAATEAAAKAASDAKAEFAKQGDDAKTELAALKAQVALGGVASQIDAWSKEGRVLPHERGGMAEFMLGLAAQGQSFSFAKGDGEAATTESTDPAKWFAHFMASRKPAVAFGKQDMGGEPAGAGLTDPSLIAQKAQAYVSEQAAKSVEISMGAAIEHVMQR